MAQLTADPPDETRCLCRDRGHGSWIGRRGRRPRCGHDHRAPASMSGGRDARSRHRRSISVDGKRTKERPIRCPRHRSSASPGRSAGARALSPLAESPIQDPCLPSSAAARITQDKATQQNDKKAACSSFGKSRGRQPDYQRCHWKSRLKRDAADELVASLKALGSIVECSFACPRNTTVAPFPTR
jgi:hypothetical protein